MKTISSLTSIVLVLLAALGMSGSARAQNGSMFADLVAVMERRDTAAMHKLLVSDPSAIRAKDTDGSTLLHQAALMNDIPLLTLLLEQGADINAVNKAGLTPLRQALRFDRAMTIEFLIQKGANIDIWAAAGMDNRQRVEALIQADSALLKVKDDYGWTPLHWAVSHHHPGMASLLVSKGADLEARNTSEMTPFHWSLNVQDHEMAERLISLGANVNALDGNGWTPLYQAAGSRELIRLLLAKGANINGANESGDTLLFRISEVSQATELIEKGANVNARNKAGWTPLFNVGSLNMLELLLSKGADLSHAKANDGTTPLYCAAGRDSKEVVARMIQKGANVNARLKNGQTPLHIAAANGRKEIAELLLAQGADVNAADQNGVTPIGMTALNGFLKDPSQPILTERSISPRAMVDLLRLVYHAEPDFYTSIFLGETERVASFLKRNPALANLNAQRGITPLQFAASVGSKDIAALLLKNGAKTRGHIPGTYSADIAWLAKWKHHEDVAALITDWRRDHEAKTQP